MGVYKVKDKYYIDFYTDGRRIRKPTDTSRLLLRQLAKFLEI